MCRSFLIDRPELGFEAARSAVRFVHEVSDMLSILRMHSFQEG